MYKCRSDLSPARTLSAYILWLLLQCFSKRRRWWPLDTFSFVIRPEGRLSSEVCSTSQPQRTLSLRMATQNVIMVAPHRLRNLNTRCPAGHMLYETLMEEMCHSSWETVKPHTSSSSLSLLGDCRWGCECSTSCSGYHACCLRPCFPSMMASHPRGNRSQNQLLFLVSFGHVVLSQQQKSNRYN